MGAKENTPEVFVRLAGSEDTMLYFSGPPRALAGTIPVINTSSEKQRLHSIGIETKKLMGQGGHPLREIPCRARIRGGQQVNLHARLPVDPYLAPGRYDFKVTLGGRALPATALVPDIVDLHVEPAAVTIIASPRSHSYTRTVICENRGNVVLLSGSQCEAPIFEGNSLVDAVLDGLHKSDRKSAESMTKAALEELAELKAGMLVIKRKAVPLSPGHIMPIELEFQLPSTLKPQRRYRVSVALYNGRLKVEIYTTSKEAAPQKQK